MGKSIHQGSAGRLHCLVLAFALALSASVQAVTPQVSAGGLLTVVVKSDGTLWAWGLNGFGQLGDGTRLSRSSPVQVGSATD